MFKSIDNFNLTKYNLDPIANNMAFINTVAEIAMISTSMVNIVSITPSSSFSSSSSSSTLRSSSSLTTTTTTTSQQQQHQQLLSSSVWLRYRIVFPSYPTQQENSAKSQAIVSAIRSEISSGNFQVVLQSYASNDSPLK